MKILNKKYQIKEKDSFVLKQNRFPLFFVFDIDFERKKRLKRHIKSEDCFGTLATILDVYRQEAEGMIKIQKDILSHLSEDLSFLDKQDKMYFYIKSLQQKINILKNEIEEFSKIRSRIINNLKEDLMFLERNYKIIKK